MSHGEPSLVPRGPGRVLQALRWSWQGLCVAFRTESSVRLEAYLVPVFVAAAFVFGEGAVERALLIGVLLPVLVAELLNSSLENIADHLWPEHNERAGRVKDIGSAAVFLAMVNVLAVWAIVLWPGVAGP